MQFTKAALAVLISALTASATTVHNEYGADGWIKDNSGTDVQLTNGNSVSLGGGEGFFWVSSSVCSVNSVEFCWPSDYGVSYLCIDWKWA
jgi:hypothetical protein